MVCAQGVQRSEAGGRETGEEILGEDEVGP